ncbi:uncharacterized protein K460DRAFT_357379 [Cucurbitaria berberidis CBS 394.84]|uniref:(S)-ureidoglycine aminohydrolase cupin domain-containing protein n=1 Tax=Cucurbitaria berberidis CBS 394.84 TaxID=1168544 RepID=A0A9P4L6C9_9PLEO|nr:uncharacterized protein K460DRAFT_357379 [Cucurbitaria berberidis CBS 394.84]KAF1843680.1 hypothetical protein K460DRAFT_357379 [Cucurbitaria berberidis CBS 394.84]
MVFESRTSNELYKIPKFFDANVQYADVYATLEKHQETTPLTTSLFYVEATDNWGSMPDYTAEETGIVLDGILSIEDETGRKVVLTKGDTWFVHRGSRILYRTDTFAVAFKAASRHLLFPDEKAKEARKALCSK